MGHASKNFKSTDLLGRNEGQEGSCICICFGNALYSINQLDISHASALLASRPLTSNVHIASTLIGAAILRFNPLSLMSDQDRISPNNINTIPSIQVMRITKNIN